MGGEGGVDGYRMVDRGTWIVVPLPGERVGEVVLSRLRGRSRRARKAWQPHRRRVGVLRGVLRPTRTGRKSQTIRLRFTACAGSGRKYALLHQDELFLAARECTITIPPNRVDPLQYQDLSVT